MCVSPLFIKSPRPKEGSLRDDVIRSPVGQYVPCGKCPECLAKRQREWYVRFWLEDKYNSSHGKFTWFTTFTYRNETLPKTREEAMLQWRAFLKKLERKLGYKVRFYTTTENGSITNRLHWHSLLFGIDSTQNTETLTELLADCWNKGFISVKPATGTEFSYVSKYVTKDTDVLKTKDSWKTITTCSKRPSLGANGVSVRLRSFLNSNPDNILHFDGYSYALPRYLANKNLSVDVLKYRRLKAPELKPCDPVHEADVYEAYNKKCREVYNKKLSRLHKYEQFSDI